MKNQVFNINGEYLFLRVPRISAPFFIWEKEYDELSRVHHEHTPMTEYEAMKEFGIKPKDMIRRINAEIEIEVENKNQRRVDELVKRRKRFEFNNSKLVNLEVIKQVPISNFIKFNHNTAKCLWHSERTPSMHYYKKDNHVKCFGCSKYADVIDVVMAINNCSFKEAVKILA